MMAHCLDIPDEPQNIEQILSDCKETLKYCVKTGSSVTLVYIIIYGEWRHDRVDRGGHDRRRS